VITPTEAAPPRPAPATRTARQRATRRRLIVVGLVLAAAAGFLLYKVLSSAVVYFKTADQAVAARQALANSSFDIEGVVVCGSVHEAASGVDRFTIASGPARVVVANSAIPPQLFEAGVPVVLYGHFIGSTDAFASQQILIKHSNNYVAAHPGRVKTPSALSCFHGQT
jgi:cytochrome c-type biogenesis protein CcmE